MLIQEEKVSIQRLKALRNRRHMDIAEYAAYLQVSAKKLGVWESEAMPPSYVELALIAIKEQVTIGWLTDKSASFEQLCMSEEQYQEFENSVREILRLQNFCEKRAASRLQKGYSLADDAELLKCNLELDKKLLLFSDKLENSPLC